MKLITQKEKKNVVHVDMKFLWNVKVNCKIKSMQNMTSDDCEWVVLVCLQFEKRHFIQCVKQWKQRIIIGNGKRGLISGFKVAQRFKVEVYSTTLLLSECVSKHSDMSVKGQFSQLYTPFWYLELCLSAKVNIGMLLMPSNGFQALWIVFWIGLLALQSTSATKPKNTALCAATSFGI